MVTCAKCGRELAAGEKVWNVKVGEFKDKQVCEGCYSQLKPELAAMVRERKPHVGPLIDDNARLNSLIASLLDDVESKLKKSQGRAVGSILSLDGFVEVPLLHSIVSVLKASVYYNELVLRKLDAIENSPSYISRTPADHDHKDIADEAYEIAAMEPF
jgi:hypothetical protein